MPVDITATEAVWTERFHRFRGVRNRPPENTSNPIHPDQPNVDLQL
jgi:hypothetical protein